MDEIKQLAYHNARILQEAEIRLADHLLALQENMIYAMRMRKPEEHDMLARLHEAHEAHHERIEAGHVRAGRAFEGLRKIAKTPPGPPPPEQPKEPSGQAQGIVESLGEDSPEEPPKKEEPPKSTKKKDGKGGKKN